MSTQTYRIEVTSVSPTARTYRIEVSSPNIVARTYRIQASAPETPIPNAGEDLKDLTAWTRVDLHGTETSNVGPSVAKSWTQISGRPVEIINPSSADAYYWALGSTLGESFEFAYRVQGADGTWSPQNIVKHTFLPSTEFAVIGGQLVPMGMIAVTTGYSLGSLTS